MADEFAVVHTVADTGGGTQDITSSDITDFAGAIIILNGATALSTDTSHARMTVAFCDASGNMFSSARRAEDGNTAVPETVTWGSQSLLQIGHPTATSSGAPTLIGTAEAVPRSTSGVANGIRLNWTNTPDAAYRMTAILFGGSTNVAVGQDNVPTTATLVNLGFEPDFVCFHSQHGNYGPTSAAALDYDVGLGFAVNDGSETQASLLELWDSGTEPVDADGYVSTVEAAGEISGGAENHVTVTAFSASGFTWDAETSVVPAQYFALEFSEDRTAAVAVETLPGSTGSQAFTGLGIRPEFVFGIANLMTSTNTLVDGATASTESIFMFNADEEYSHSCHHEEGITITNPPTSNAESRTENTALWVYTHDGSEAVDAAFTSLDSSGFTLNFSTATAGRMVVFAVQQAGVGPLFANETEEISEQLITVRQFPTQVDETEEISEDLVAVRIKLGQADEVVEISDAIVTSKATAPTVTGAQRNGSTLQAGAARGSSLQSGAQVGTTQ